jgi:hypothetical protein
MTEAARAVAAEGASRKFRELEQILAGKQAELEQICRDGRAEIAELLSANSLGLARLDRMLNERSSVRPVLR